MSVKNEPKTYVLLEALNATAPIYQRVNKEQRVRVTKPQAYPLHLQVPVRDESGVNMTLRYKSTSNTILMKQQVSKDAEKGGESMEVNEKFTPTERNDVTFKYGSIVTTKKVLQEYLEAYPAFEGSPYTSDEVRGPLYKLIDKPAEIKTTNEQLKKRVEAANYIFKLNLEDAKAKLIQINGSHFETPEELEECQNLLVEYLDNFDTAYDDILNTEETVDDKITITVGKLINAKIIKFEVSGHEDQVCKKKGTQWVPVKKVAGDNLNERIRLFEEYLKTDKGSLLLADLEKDLDNKNK